MTLRVSNVKNIFCNVYNEDWLFRFGNPSARFSVSPVAPKQLAYDPFESPQVAMWQEFYDLIAEGVSKVANLSECKKSEYWTHQLALRRKHYNSLLSICENSEIIRCLITGQEMLKKIRASDCLDFTEGYIEAVKI